MTHVDSFSYSYCPYTIFQKLPFSKSPFSETPLAFYEYACLLHFKSLEKCLNPIALMHLLLEKFENWFANKNFMPQNKLFTVLSLLMFLYWERSWCSLIKACAVYFQTTWLSCVLRKWTKLLKKKLKNTEKWKKREREKK